MSQPWMKYFLLSLLYSGLESLSQNTETGWQLMFSLELQLWLLSRMKLSLFSTIPQVNNQNG